MQYSPEHIETVVHDYEAKGGYSATKLLKQSMQQNDSMVGGAGEARATGTTGEESNVSESLFEKLQHLQVPLGLVSRRYPSNVRRHTDVDDKDTEFLDSKIFEELEAMIFHSKNRETRKNVKIMKSANTKKIRPTKHSKNT
jgi:hypothetical protein